jgi:hypothetical protein
VRTPRRPAGIDASKLPEYGSQASKFGTVITFEDIAAAYPHATKAT